jgi:hypothetical protein
MITRHISWGDGGPVRKADNLATFMRRLSKNLGASNSWNPKDLSRPVNGIALPLQENNSEIYKLYDEHYVVKFIKLGGLRWAGHLMRIDESDPARKVLCTNQEELEIEKE